MSAGRAAHERRVEESPLNISVGSSAFADILHAAGIPPSDLLHLGDLLHFSQPAGMVPDHDPETLEEALAVIKNLRDQRAAEGRANSELNDQLDRVVERIASDLADKDKTRRRRKRQQELMTLANARKASFCGAKLDAVCDEARRRHPSSLGKRIEWAMETYDAWVKEDPDSRRTYAESAFKDRL